MRVTLAIRNSRPGHGPLLIALKWARASYGCAEILDRIVRWQCKECRGWFCPLYVREAVGSFAHTWIIRCTGDDHLEVLGEPFLSDGSNGTLVAHCASGNGRCYALALSDHSFNRL